MPRQSVVSLIVVLSLLAGLVSCGPTEAPPEPVDIPPSATPVPAEPVSPEATPLSSSATVSYVVVDNNDPDFSVEAGDWGTCQNGDCSGTCFGDDFRYAEPGCSDCRTRFDFTTPTTGEYDVWAWWPWAGCACSVWRSSRRGSDDPACRGRDRRSIRARGAPPAGA